MGGNFEYALPWYVPVLTSPMPGLRWMPGIMSIWLQRCARIMEEAKGPGAVMGPGMSFFLFSPLIYLVVQGCFYEC